MLFNGSKLNLNSIVLKEIKSDVTFFPEKRLDLFLELKTRVRSDMEINANIRAKKDEERNWDRTED